MGLLPVVMLLSMQAQVSSGPVNVFAAASLKDAFTSIARAYESAHPGSKVRLNFGGSQLLAAQINHGAPADVFASAARINLQAIVFDKRNARIFAQNRLILVVRHGYVGITSPRVFGWVERIVIADPSVPVGQYTQEFFEKGVKAYGQPWLVRVQSKIVSKELDVKAVLAKVRLGEADAGVVYVSDALSARGQVQAVTIPDELNTLAEYPVVVPNQAPNPERAKDFVKFLFTPESQRTLEANGFISPLRSVKSFPIVDLVSMRRTIQFPSKKGYPIISLTVKGHAGEAETVKGFLFSAVLGRTAAKTATFFGADTYSQTLPLAELRSRKALLVLRPDGNYQLVVPGLEPSVWVNWLRRIELR